MRRLTAGLGRRVALMLALISAACGSDGDPARSDTADPALAPLVGRWNAVVFLVTTPDGADTVDVLAQSTFILEIEAAGTYTATLNTFGVAVVETGQITIDSATALTLRPTSPPGAGEQVTWGISAGTLVLDGATEFDFNGDQTSDPAQAHIELRKS